MNKENLRKLSPLGLGFWQAWWVIAMCTPLVIPSAASLGSTAETGLLSQLSVVVLASTALGYLAIVIFAKRFAPLSQKRAVHLAAAALASIGSLGMSLLAWLLPASSLFIIAYLASLILFSLGNALLLMLWGELWSTLASGTVGRHLYASYLFAFVLFFIITALPTTIAFIITALLPSVSVVILLFAESLPRRSVIDEPRIASQLPVARIFIAIGLINVVWGLFQGCVGLLPAEANLTSNALLLAGALLAAFIIWMALYRPTAEPLAMYAPIIPALVTGMVLMVILPQGFLFIGDGIAIFGGYCLDMLIMLVACDMAHKHRIPVALSFGLAIFVARAGTFIGSMIIRSQSSLEVSAVHIWILLAVIAVVLIGVLIFSQADLQKLYRASAPVKKMDMTVQQRCSLVAQVYKLSARETEVLVLLAHGRSGPYIGTELSIAHGTVKRHISNIYRKIGVYDRQSLHDIIAAASEQ